MQRDAISDDELRKEIPPDAKELRMRTGAMLSEAEIDSLFRR
jgi:hypothetical protein